MIVEFGKWYDDRDRFVPSFDSETTRVQPNLALSVQDIYERWRKNLPLDVVMRNGEFLPTNMSDEKAFDLPDDSRVDDYTDDSSFDAIAEKLTSDFTSSDLSDDGKSEAASEAQRNAAGSTSSDPSQNQEQ